MNATSSERTEKGLEGNVRMGIARAGTLSVEEEVDARAGSLWDISVHETPRQLEPSPLARGSAWRSTSHATLRLARITKLVYRTNRPNSETYVLIPAQPRSQGSSETPSLTDVPPECTK